MPIFEKMRERDTDVHHEKEKSGKKILDVSASTRKYNKELKDATKSTNRGLKELAIKQKEEQKKVDKPFLEKLVQNPRDVKKEASEQYINDRVILNLDHALAIQSTLETFRTNQDNL